MNKEELLNKYIDLIDKGYCSDCNELNCIDNFPHAKITHAIRELQQENKKLREILNEIKNIDIFKEFSFPLMKRWEEQQVLSSIDYQFKNTFIKKIEELERSDSNE